MTPTPPRRLYMAAESVADLPCVTTARVSDSEGYDRPVVSVVVGPDEETVPPRVLRRVINYDLGVRDVSPQGSHTIVIAY